MFRLDSRQSVEDGSVNSTHFFKALNRNSFVRLVGVSVTQPSCSNADGVGYRSGIRASTHCARLGHISGFSSIDIYNSLDEWMIFREVERRRISFHLEAPRVAKICHFGTAEIV